MYHKISLTLFYEIWQNLVQSYFLIKELTFLLTFLNWEKTWINIKGTAVLPQNHSFDSVWSKIGTLQDCIVLCKSVATPLPTLRFLTTNESFQKRYCMNFFFKGHQNCQKSNLKVHEKSCFIKWIWKAKTLTSGHSDAPWGKSSYSTSFESSH